MSIGAFIITIHSPRIGSSLKYFNRTLALAVASRSHERDLARVAEPLEVAAFERIPASKAARSMRVADGAAVDGLHGCTPIG
jgi:hypothetical protein